MRMRVFLLLALIVFAAPAWAQDGTAGHDASRTVARKTPAISPPPVRGGRTPFGVQSAPQRGLVGTGGWWRMIVDAQRAFQKKMAAAMRALKTGDAMSAALFLIGMSFLYGIFHAAGPGHGKAVISSYMLANKTTLRRGIVIAVLAALVQACSAVILVGVSALLIAAAGLYFLTVHLRRQFVSQNAAGNCVAGSDEMPDPRTLEKKLVLHEVISIVLAVGIRPCTGAIIVLLFSLRLGILWAGIISAFVMAAGTAITVSALASLAVGSRELAARFAGSRWTDRFYDYATIAVCLLVTVVGASLFWHSLGPMRPF